MIAFVRGILVSSGSDFVILESSGIGYKVYVPTSLLYKLPRAGTELMLHTHYYVREDGVFLYGFLEAVELELFELLITTSGIGPKVALGLLGATVPDSLAQAILREDLITLTKLPGIGKKTGQRMILELKDKLGKIWTMAEGPLLEVMETVVDGQDTDAELALISLGYQQKEARQAVAKVLRESEGLSTEQLIKRALRELM